MRRLLTLIFFLFAGTIAYAQDDAVVEADTATLEEVYEAGDYQGEYSESTGGMVDPRNTSAAAAYMNEDQTVKKFNEKDWKAIVGDVTFEEKPPRPDPKKEEKDKSDKGSNFPSIDPAFAKIFSYVVIFILFAAILYFVARNTRFSQSIKKMKPGDVAAPVENIEEVDIDGLLKQALADGDLRGAIRVHYLMLLKKLNEVGLIVWKKDKTNRDYLSELYGRNDCYEDVRRLTHAYEVVWYGERSVSQDSFQRISGEFESVNRQVVKGTPEA